MNEILLEELKLKCYISLDNTDADTSRRFESLCEDSEIKVAHLLELPKNFDFSAPGPARELLKNYVFYAHNDCSNEFESNYLADIYEAREYYSQAI